MQPFTLMAGIVQKIAALNSNPAASIVYIRTAINASYYI